MLAGEAEPTSPSPVTHIFSLYDATVHQTAANANLSLFPPVDAYLDIGLIDSPRAASGPTKAVSTLDELWGISPDPSQDGRMGQTESALGHHFDQIPKAGLVAQI